MAKRNCFITIIALLLATALLGVGYAVVTDDLFITGDIVAEGKPFKGVYIKAVSVVESANASSLLCDFNKPTNLVSSVDATRTGGSITYKITVHNNTDVTYWYIGTKQDVNYYQNSLLNTSGGIQVLTRDHLADKTQSFDSEDWIPPHTERDFFATYTFGENAQSTCQTMINFHFDIRMDAVHDEFLAVLNNVNSSTAYEELIAVFNSQYAENRSVSISNETHPALFSSLFGDLMVDFDGVERQANVVIRRENMDGDATSGDEYSGNGPDGCEYTLYITVESLNPGSQPTVYAIAYSRGAEGMGENWYQVGELYKGTATVNADGSVNYESWRASAQTYEIADGISYNVGYANGDQYDIMKTMEDLVSAKDQDIFNDIDNRNIFKKVYDIIQKHATSFEPAVVGLRQAFDDAAKFYVNHNNGQEFKVVRDKYTRAEIIYALKNIQKALDYYYQAYPD